jgi:hypothetical protein
MLMTYITYERKKEKKLSIAYKRFGGVLFSVQRRNPTVTTQSSYFVAVVQAKTGSAQDVRGGLQSRRCA